MSAPTESGGKADRAWSLVRLGRGWSQCQPEDTRELVWGVLDAFERRGRPGLEDLLARAGLFHVTHAVEPAAFSLRAPEMPSLSVVLRCAFGSEPESGGGTPAGSSGSSSASRSLQVPGVVPTAAIERIVLQAEAGLAGAPPEAVVVTAAAVVAVWRESARRGGVGFVLAPAESGVPDAAVWQGVVSPDRPARACTVG